MTKVRAYNPDGSEYNGPAGAVTISHDSDLGFWGWFCFIYATVCTTIVTVFLIFLLYTAIADKLKDNTMCFEPYAHESYLICYER